MIGSARLFAVWLAMAGAVLPGGTQVFHHGPGKAHARPAQETGFLNRKILLHGAQYRFQVYLPEEWRREDEKAWPVILFLHGRGERGAEGMWQTQIGLPEAVRDHPERWPFVMVMPQCAQGAYWTDPAMMELALAALDQETEEFHGDRERTYLTGLSMGGYGAWELARMNPHRWAAVAIAAGGIFWSWTPERWQHAATLPGEYARAIGQTPIWLFHGTSDPLVAPRQSELMFEAVKAAGGRIRLWLYQGLQHDCWTRAYNEPELPRWLLGHSLGASTAGSGATPYAERVVIPQHPAAIRLAGALLDSLAGEYRDANGRASITILRQGEQLSLKNQYGQVIALEAEPTGVFFDLNGPTGLRYTFERDRQGHVCALVVSDDRHEERWERRGAAPGR